MHLSILSQVYIYVVEKASGKVLPVVYASEPFFFFHVINAFQVDVDKYIYLDIMAYKDAEVSNGGWAKALHFYPDGATSFLSTNLASLPLSRS